MRKFFLPSLIAALLSISCSDNSSTPGTLDVPEELNPSKESPKEDVSATTLVGSVQGESFKEGTVELFELDEKLVQTGTTVKGVSDSMSRYSVSTAEFTSPYAELVVSGKSVQPCSGREVDSKISVIVDLSKDSTVSLNLFTYFTSERLKELVKNGKMEISKAWEQAEKEVRTLFALPEGESALEAFAASALFDRLAERTFEKNAPEWRSKIAAAFAREASLPRTILSVSLAGLHSTTIWIQANWIGAAISRKKSLKKQRSAPTCTPCGFRCLAQKNARKNGRAKSTRSLIRGCR